MIFFELFKELDERMYRIAREVDPLINTSCRYLIENDDFVILGSNVSLVMNIRTREIREGNPYQHFDLGDETLYWFSADSAEGAAVRMISNAFRQWYGIEAFKSFAEFERSEADINRQLAGYGLRMIWDMDKMAVFRNEEVMSLERAVAQIIEDDALRTAGISVEEWLYDARYFRRTDQLDRAVEQYERVIRYAGYNDRVYTESAFCLGESYYFMGEYDRAVSMYYHCNLKFIEDEKDFYIHIGHALLDVKMKNYEKELRTYYRGSLDRTYAENHIREIERAAAEVAGEYEAYEQTCLVIGLKKYNEHMAPLPLNDTGFVDIVEENGDADDGNKPEPAKNRYYDIRLVKPSVLTDTGSLSVNETMAEALRLLTTGEYQRAFELYYKLSQSLDPKSDHATWVNFQLGKIYCICDDARSSFEVLRRCIPGKFGVVYRQSDYFILYTHVRILCDDFESDRIYRKLIRGKFDRYYARYDSEYIGLCSNPRVMKNFRRYEQECLMTARQEFRPVLGREDATAEAARREGRLLRGISRYFNE
ncbi:MAG: hypothetical protein K6E53_04945 [Lachnospiraceae bacterium]|nr:hypothetical protein [Lachnospiraceae bacterium]